MRELFESVKARLVAEGITAHFVAITGPATYPYALLWGSPGRLSRDTLADAEALSDWLSVTWVSLSPLGCLDLARVGREALADFTPTSSLWQMQPLRLEGLGQDVQIDRDATAPSSNTYPFFAVDRFRLVGDPI